MGQTVRGVRQRKPSGYPASAKSFLANVRSYFQLSLSSGLKNSLESTIGKCANGEPRPKKAALTISSRLVAWATALRARASLNGGLVPLKRRYMNGPSVV